MPALNFGGSRSVAANSARSWRSRIPFWSPPITCSETGCRTTMWALSTVCGRKRTASRMAAALSAAIAAGRGAPFVRTRRTVTGWVASYSRAPTHVSVTTRVVIRGTCVAMRSTSSWIPPVAGGKSGVTTSSRGLPDITAAQTVQPEAKREHRPQRL